MTTNNAIIGKIADDKTLGAAYSWLSQQKHTDDVVSLHKDWKTIKPQIQARLVAGEYAFQPLTRVHGTDQLQSGKPESRDLWAAQDRIVLKAMTLVLEQQLHETVSPRCYHSMGRGGAKAAVRSVREYLRANPDAWVMQSDIKGYYANIDHHTLYAQLESLMPNEKYSLK